MCHPFRRRAEELYVVTFVFNPQRYKSRITLYKEFEERMLEAGVTLIVVEANLRHHPPEITQKMGKKHHIIHVEAECHLWLKENLINIGIEYLNKKFPKWKYVAWIDADIAFVRPDWVKETKRLLQTHPIIQMFSRISQLDSNYEPPLHGHTLSFMKGWTQGVMFRDKKVSKEDPCQIIYGWNGAPGGAWAATRECIDRIFPLFDINILGAGDYHTAIALVGWGHLTFTKEHTDSYKWCLVEWEKKAKFLRGKIGYMRGLIVHYWHGSIKNRGYDTRWKILVKHKYDPRKDLRKNKDGVYFIHKKEELIGDIQKYFEARKEDET